MKPIEEQTVKALSWQMVYGNYRSKLGAEGWEQLEQSVGAPEFKGMDTSPRCEDYKSLVLPNESRSSPFFSYCVTEYASFMRFIILLTCIQL